MAASAASPRSVWRTHRVERLYVDEEPDPPALVALVRAPAGPPTLGMRIDAVPEEGREFMSAAAWATICVTNFEEAIETMDEPGRAPSEGGIRWLET